MSVFSELTVAPNSAGDLVVTMARPWWHAGQPHIPHTVHHPDSDEVQVFLRVPFYARRRPRINEIFHPENFGFSTDLKEPLPCPAD